MLGTIINAAVIVIASITGILLGSRFNETLKIALIQALGLVVLLIGVSMALKTENILILTASILLGTAIGETMKIENWLERAGARIERKFKGSKFAEGFVSSTLLFCVGSMAFVGSIQEGLTGDATILLTKSMLDGVAAIALSSTLGIGVMFSSISVLIYQGFFTLLASFISPYMTQHVVAEITATGGLLIMAIGLKLLEVKNLKVGNMLPALLVAPVLAYFF